MLVLQYSWLGIGEVKVAGAAIWELQIGESILGLQTVVGLHKYVDRIVSALINP